MVRTSGDIDAALRVLGWPGRFQVMQTVMCQLGSITAAIHVLSIVFIAKDFPHSCASDGELDDNATTTSEPSTIVKNCTSADCGHEVYTSLREEWGLVCERAPEGDLLQSVLAGGMLVGAMVVPSLADRYGRKPVYLGANILLLAAGVGGTFSPNYLTLAALRFFIGAFSMGCMLVSFVMNMEHVTMEKRKLVIVISALFWASGILALIPIGYAMKGLSWRHLHLAYSLVPAYCLVQYWLTDETPRWLEANGKVEELDETFKKAARMNKVDLQKVMDAYRSKEMSPAAKEESKRSDGEVSDYGDEPEGSMLKNGSAETSTEKAAKISILDAFKNRRFMVISAVSCLLWAVNSLTYYGLNLTSSTLADDLYLAFFLNAMVELPGFLGLFLFVDRLGRRRSAILFQSLAGLSLLISVVLRTVTDNTAGHIAGTFFALFGKFSIFISFNVLYIFTPELFPTNARNLGMGMSSSAARVGGMLAPFFKSLGEVVSWAPGVLLGTLCLLATLLILLLPETRGRRLPQRFDDMEEWDKK